ncbi:COX15/CtaA family protein [Cytobacillus massiliigabonensis]|uniref:COX15/CtaA family protein n=1 Tax=Cytobacillus massiliigabonensis TaxID=1871011 RepID=UPI00115BB78A|nr:COX15/CtaA family protein [Cytobacillus massiliigabonensis]
MNRGRLALVTILLTYLLIVFGGYVASSESGMGCGPEWPLCNGAVIPILQGDTLIEFAHRVIGAILGIMSVLLFVKIIRSHTNTTIRSVAWGMLFLLTVQILLGAVVVILDLPAIVVTGHLLVAMIFLASLIWLWRSTGKKETKDKIHTVSINIEKRKQIIKHLNIVLVLLLLTLVFGAYIKHESYGLACGWLTCGDSLFPNTLPAILQTIHRVLAVISTIYLLQISFWAFSKRWGVAMQNRLFIAVLVVLLQLLIGVLTVISYLDIPWAVLHLAIGTALFGFVYEARAFAGIHMPLTRKPRIAVNEHNKSQM